MRKNINVGNARKRCERKADEGQSSMENTSESQRPLI